MRMMLSDQMGWLAIPFVLAVGIAYVWAASRFIERKAKRLTVTRVTPEPAAKRAA